MAWLGAEQKNNVGKILIWRFGDDSPNLVYHQI